MGSGLNLRMLEMEAAGPRWGWGGAGQVSSRSWAYGSPAVTVGLGRWRVYSRVWSCLGHGRELWAEPDLEPCLARLLVQCSLAFATQVKSWTASRSSEQKSPSGLSAHCTLRSGCLGSLQPWGPVGPGLLDTARGLQMTSDPRPPRADPLYPQALFSQGGSAEEEGGMAASTCGWQNLAAPDLHLFPAQMIQAGCCWGWGGGCSLAF